MRNLTLDRDRRAAAIIAHHVSAHWQHLPAPKPRQTMCAATAHYPRSAGAASIHTFIGGATFADAAQVAKHGPGRLSKKRNRLLSGEILKYYLEVPFTKEFCVTNLMLPDPAHNAIGGLHSSLHSKSYKNQAPQYGRMSTAQRVTGTPAAAPADLSQTGASH